MTLSDNRWRKLDDGRSISGMGSYAHSADNAQKEAKNTAFDKAARAMIELLDEVVADARKAKKKPLTAYE